MPGDTSQPQLSKRLAGRTSTESSNWDCDLGLGLSRFGLLVDVSAVPKIQTGAGHSACCLRDNVLWVDDVRRHRDQGQKGGMQGVPSTSDRDSVITRDALLEMDSLTWTRKSIPSEHATKGPDALQPHCARLFRYGRPRCRPSAADLNGPLMPRLCPFDTARLCYRWEGKLKTEDRGVNMKKDTQGSDPILILVTVLTSALVFVASAHHFC